MAVEVSISNNVNHVPDRLQDFIAILCKCDCTYLAQFRAVSMLQQRYDKRIYPWRLSHAEAVVGREPHVVPVLFPARAFIRHNIPI